MDATASDRVRVNVDGRTAEVPRGTTILQAARQMGVTIPTLCHYRGLSPYGACRVCSVELEANGRTMVVAACTYPAERNVVVRTRTEKLDRIRKALVEMMMAHAPDSEKLLELAKLDRRPDFAVTNEINLALFQLLPVMFATWYISRRAGIAIAVLTLGSWVAIGSVVGGRCCFGCPPVR